MTHKKIGLLLGNEEDWPKSFEMLSRHMGPLKYKKKTLELSTERVRIHPFNLKDEVSYDIVIDRLAWWHPNPREWLKKSALMNGTYLLNNPFTFQSMEKHSAYCAMTRLGFRVPETWLIPQKKGPDNERYRETSEKYHDMFNLPEIARDIGYPLFMKPFDGGGWRGVSKIDNEHDLAQAYDESGQTMMHLQRGLVDYEVFVRSLGIGPQIITLNYDPSKPMHERYVISHNFLDSERGKEAAVLTKIINAFFRWDFNSCEAILKDNTLWPMDFANANPDIAVTSLHYYFPWAIKALYAWTAFCLATDRPMHINLDIEPYFKIADSERSYEEKLEAYEKLADKHLETEKFNDFRQTSLKELDEVMWELVQSQPFDAMLVETVRKTFPDYEHDKFIAHFRGLMKHWVEAENPQA